MKKHLDFWSLAVIIITFILFVIALFTKGTTHDLLLEAGVFLVSVKLIIMGYKARLTSKDIFRELEEIKTHLKIIEHKNGICESTGESK